MAIDSDSDRDLDLLSGNMAAFRAIPHEALRVSVWNGHYMNGKHVLDERWVSRKLQDMCLWDKQVRALVHDPNASITSREFTCGFCGERIPLAFRTDHFEAVGQPCPFPNGLETTFELNVPSGRICVDDDLREWFPIDQDGDDINQAIGRHQYALHHAEAGLAMGFVGNSCPSVYKHGEGFRVGGKAKKAKRLAGICTDLWWYSICDAEELERRFARYSPEVTLESWAKDSGGTIISVKPGVYRFQNFHVFDDEGRPLYATAEWVREPDPVHDFVGEDDAKCSTATEVLFQSILEWPTLYLPYREPYSSYDDRLSWGECSEEQQTTALARAADHYICVIGGGVEWHENGFPRSVISDEAKRLACNLAESTGLPYGEVPLFDTQFHWYPLSPGYGGFSVGIGRLPSYSEPHRLWWEKHIRMNRSFARLAQNVGRCMLLYPEVPRLNREAWPPYFEVKDARDRLTFVATGLLRYADEYSDDVVDPDLVNRIRELGPEAFAATIDLGPDLPPAEEWPPKPKLLSVTAKYAHFNVAKLASPKFCGGGYWRRKEDAAGVCFPVFQGLYDNRVIAYGSAKNELPFEWVARVVSPQSGARGPLVEIEFDYGSPMMYGSEKLRWFVSREEEQGVEFFDDDARYDTLRSGLSHE